ncbi:hypothetical protein, partial [Nocardia abscessus]|uniref:hypothetical protein n=1 Tax=Nocardia abscessus TaxID=120957 RepID=UPI002455876C
GGGGVVLLTSLSPPLSSVFHLFFFAAVAAGGGAPPPPPPPAPPPPPPPNSPGIPARPLCTDRSGLPSGSHLSDGASKCSYVRGDVVGALPPRRSWIQGRP